MQRGRTDVSMIHRHKPDVPQIQLMAACPSRLMRADPVPAGWQPYHGNPKWFHCGFRGILEDRLPTPEDPQNECFYDPTGYLVDDTHEYSGCGGTPNQYDSDDNPIAHSTIDSGGIIRSGPGAFAESRRYERNRLIEDLKREGRKALDWRNWVNLGR